MKFASYRVRGRDSFGIVTSEGVHDLGLRCDIDIPDLKTLIALNFHGIDRSVEHTTDFAFSDIEFCPVIPNPSMIICAGLNTYSHLAEFRKSRGSDAPPPPKPWLFLRLPRSFTGHEQPIEKPNISPVLDYEGEIVLIVGKAGRHIKKTDAASYIAGYSCCNEGSVRDFQLHSPQFTAGKNFMRSGSIGPWMVTADEIDKPEALSVTTRVNGVVMQEMPYSDLIFKFDELISYISIFTEILPGDMIVTGTGEGVGSLRSPQCWLNEGDVCEVEVTGIGTLRNSISEAVGVNRSAETRTDAYKAITEARAIAGVRNS